MRFVDQLRIRQVIALIVLLPMIVGSVAVGLLAVEENRARTDALQELDDLDLLLVVRGTEASVAAERAFYQGWYSLQAANGSGEGSTFLTPAVRTSISASVQELGDAAITSIEAMSFEPDQREEVNDVLVHWSALRAAFDADDIASVDEEAARLDDAVVALGAIADAAVVRQGTRWLAIDRQSRFGIALAEEMSYIGVLLTSGRTNEPNRQRAAVLSDRTTAAFEAMMETSTPEQRGRLESIQQSERIADLRREAILATPTMSFPELVSSLVGLAEVTDVVGDVRFESADAIRLAAADKATTASRNRNLAVGLAVVVLVGPLALLLGIGGRVSRRLDRLAVAARRVSNGEMDVRIDDVSGRDEVAEVSLAFNDVAETIARSHDQISALAEGRIDDPVLDDELPGIIGQTLRLALRRLGNATAELAHQANHDKLTGLLDRRGLQSGIDSLGRREVDGEENPDRGMILVDLDDFKQINDVHGHAAGDAVLREVADRLVAGTRSVDLVARLGGDEFLVLTAVFETCEATAERLAERIAAPIEWSGLLLPVTASIGWTSVGIDEHFEDVLHRADRAMYSAKRSGKNQSFAG